MFKHLSKNKKGFTLIELVAAVAILGILTGISVVAITRVIASGKENHYTTAEANMVLAGQSYTQHNRNALPKAIGQKKKITLKTLIDNKYIQPIKDYNDNECDTEQSYVQVYKYSQSDYSYIGHLSCPKYNSDSQTYNKPTISIALNRAQTSATVTLTGSSNADEPIKLSSYSYIVYLSYEQNGTTIDKEIINTGSVQIAGNPVTRSVNINLEDYTTSQIKVMITAVNIYGMTATRSYSQVLNDTSAPQCIIKLEDINEKEWINEDRTITIGCNDGAGSGCVQDEYQKTFTESERTGTITIEDRAGNKTNCNVSVYIDKDAPSCDIRLNNPYSLNSSFIVNRTSTTEHSDIVGVSIGTSPIKDFMQTSIPFAEGIFHGYIEDKAGNNGTCSIEIIDGRSKSCTNSRYRIFDNVCYQYQNAAARDSNRSTCRCYNQTNNSLTEKTISNNQITEAQCAQRCRYEEGYQYFEYIPQRYCQNTNLRLIKVDNKYYCYQQKRAATISVFEGCPSGFQVFNRTSFCYRN